MPSERDRLIERRALDFEARCTRGGWQAAQFLRLLPIFRSSRLRRYVCRWILGYVRDYRRTNCSAVSDEVDVSQEIDFQVPFDSSVLPDYLSTIAIWMGGINFLRHEFGDGVIPEIEDAVERVATFYPEAAEIFAAAQTTFDRGTEGGTAVRLLRMMDKSRNAAPSLHVEVTTYAWVALSGILERQALAAEDAAVYEPLAGALFRITVRICESVLLLKQHVVRDVGLALALLTAKEPVGFPCRRAHELISALFGRDRHGMNDLLIAAIRNAIREVYDEVSADIERKRELAPAEAVVTYLRNLRPLDPQ